MSHGLRRPYPGLTIFVSFYPEFRCAPLRALIPTPLPGLFSDSFSIERSGEVASLLIAMAENIESHLIEKRVFKPAKKFAGRARIGSLARYRRLYRESIQQPDKFWAREASELVWQRRWKKS